MILWISVSVHIWLSHRHTDSPTHRTLPEESKHDSTRSQEHFKALVRGKRPFIQYSYNEAHQFIHYLVIFERMALSPDSPNFEVDSTMQRTWHTKRQQRPHIPQQYAHNQPVLPHLTSAAPTEDDLLEVAANNRLSVTLRNLQAVMTTDPSTT